MANPTRPKDAKPRAEGDDFEINQTQRVDNANTGASMLSVIAIVVVAVVVTIATNYFFIDVKLSQMSKKMSEMSFASAEDDETDYEEEGVKSERGIILDLGEFILNLSDVKSRKFLKVNVAIELSKKDTDLASAQKPAGGGHGHGAAAPVDPMAEIEKEMNQFKPSIRDSIISILSSKTSEELATTPGKELAKEQIKEAINAIFEGDREVLRVSFGSFFIQ